MSAASDFDKLVKQLKRAGWKVDKTTRGHWRMASPEGGVVIASGTPSDHRAISNLRSQLKRAGYKPVMGRPRKERPAPAPSPAPAPVVEGPPPPPPAPTSGAIEQDIAALDRALSALADVEQIIRRYRDALTLLSGGGK